MGGEADVEIKFGEAVFGGFNFLRRRNRLDFAPPDYFNRFEEKSARPVLGLVSPAALWAMRDAGGNRGAAGEAFSRLHDGCADFLRDRRGGAIAEELRLDLPYLVHSRRVHLEAGPCVPPAIPVLGPSMQLHAIVKIRVELDVRPGKSGH